MALHTLDGFNERYKGAINTANILFEKFNKLDEIEISPIKNGSNIYKMKLSKNVNTATFLKNLFSHNILLSRPNESGEINLMVNESIQRQNPEVLFKAFQASLKTK